ncbi:hypothetical protein [uncultured Arcobacter sp.]|uniref:hypothetical protein n=1 Tax=uncultured Arcobacter sp. TaxID=165434 RepID=UPI0026093B79|nr:hypothetical protein [uncultured Arcobacter sp.]
MAKYPPESSYLLAKITKNDPTLQKKDKRIKLGSLCAWYYPDPKWQKTNYDTIPLVLILNADKTHVFGINLHFISWSQRLSFMKYILSKKGRVKYIDIKKAFQKAKVPQALAYYALRKYLISHIRSNVFVFDEDDWYRLAKDFAPKFVGGSAQQIYTDIQKRFTVQRKKINTKKK